MSQEQIKGIQRVIDFMEREKIKTNEQMIQLRGSTERLDWSIKVMQLTIQQIQQEIIQKQQAEEALRVAREEGNIGVHPDVRKETLQQRKKSDKNP